MKQSLLRSERHQPTRTGRPLRSVALAGALATLGLVLPGCDLGTPQGAIRGVSQSAPKLEEFNARGNYSPYFATAEMNIPRYFHEAFLASGGRVFVFGGSDERGLASLDTVEIYDQSTFDSDLVPPESGSGLWIDTNFEGDPMLIPSGGRVWFTATELSDNRVILIGGSQNLGASAVIGKAEIFDPLTRNFVTLDREMTVPRFSHTTLQISSGDLLIVGGQIQDNVANQADPNDPNDNPFQNGGQTGQGGIQQNQAVFPSTGSIEIFSQRDLTFSPLQTISGSDSELQTQRGRSAHGMTRIAGPDNILNSSDDIYVILGGFQTLSAASGQAPANKAILIDEGVVQIEVYNPQTNIVTLIAGLRLAEERPVLPEAVNLGTYNDFTPDGVRGMGNAILITGGIPVVDQLFIANYLPGAGPAQGVQFFEVVEDRFFSYVQGSEYPNSGLTERVATNTVSLPRSLPTVPGVDDVATWVFALAGDGSASASLPAGCVFDPFFSQRSAFLFNLEPNNLENERRTDAQNFLGIVGTWMTLDGFVTQSLDDFATTPASRFANPNVFPRVWGVNVQIPGVDGIRNTFDDRILLCGGGDELEDGGDPVVPSAEVFITPGSGDL